MIISGSTMNIDKVTVNGKDLKTTINILTYNNAGVRNSQFRGKSLGTVITDAQIKAIRNGSFEDLYLGDYWMLTINGRNRACQIVGFDLNVDLIYQTGTHQVVLWIYAAGSGYSMNDTSSVEGHFLNSKMYTEHLPEILENIKQAIPNENLITWSESIGDSIDAEWKVNHRTSANVQIGLPSLAELHGTPLSGKEAYSRMPRWGQWPALRYSAYLRRGTPFMWCGESYNASAWRMFNGDPIISSSINAAATKFNNVDLLVSPYVLLGVNS